MINKNYTHCTLEDLNGNVISRGKIISKQGNTYTIDDYWENKPMNYVVYEDGAQKYIAYLYDENKYNQLLKWIEIARRDVLINDEDFKVIYHEVLNKQRVYKRIVCLRHLGYKTETELEQITVEDFIQKVKAHVEKEITNKIALIKSDTDIEDDESRVLCTMLRAHREEYLKKLDKPNITKGYVLENWPSCFHSEIRYIGSLYSINEMDDAS